MRADLPSPWPRIMTFGLFVVAFLIAVAKGTTLGALIVSLVAIPSAIYLGAWVFAYARGGRPQA